MKHRRSPATLLVVACGALACAVPAAALQATPDTAAARLIVDSLVRAGAWRIATDTVRLPPDTVYAGGFDLDTTLRISALVAGLLVMASLAVATFLFARRFLAALDHRASIGVRSRWGGFGGGDDGWELTPAMTLLAATLVLAVLTAVLATAVIGAAGRNGGTEPPTAGADG